MKLRNVKLLEVMEWDFRTRSDSAPAKAHRKPRRSQVLVLHSKSGNQVKFVYETVMVTNRRGEERRVYHSELLTLEGASTWSPFMLQEYAHAAGFHLVGVKTFEQHVAEITRRLRRRLRQMFKDGK